MSPSSEQIDKVLRSILSNEVGDSTVSSPWISDPRKFRNLSKMSASVSKSQNPGHSKGVYLDEICFSSPQGRLRSQGTARISLLLQRNHNLNFEQGQSHSKSWNSFCPSPQYTLRIKHLIVMQGARGRRQEELPTPRGCGDMIVCYRTIMNAKNLGTN